MYDEFCREGELGMDDWPAWSRDPPDEDVFRLFRTAVPALFRMKKVIDRAMDATSGYGSADNWFKPFHNFV